MADGTETLICAAAKAIFDDEFTTEGFVAGNDKLLRAAGKDGSAQAAVSANFSEPDRNVQCQLNVEVLVQLYLAFDPTPNDSLVIDPTTIQNYGARIRSAFSPAATSGISDELWYFTVGRIEYPDDPTGNKTRLEARVIGYADNQAAMP